MRVQANWSAAANVSQYPRNNATTAVSAR
jgi:hypothetical protein